MCCCGKPTKNGEPGYSWDGKTRGVYPANPPDLAEGDTLIYDEPGRCGGQDSHAYHFRVVKDCNNIYLDLLVRHGGGDERMHINRLIMVALSVLDSNGRYWVLCAIYHAQAEAGRKAQDRTNKMWNKAAAEKRIKTRKLRGSSAVKVWIEPETVSREA